MASVASFSSLLLSSYTVFAAAFFLVLVFVSFFGCFDGGYLEALPFFENICGIFSDFKFD